MFCYNNAMFCSAFISVGGYNQLIEKFFEATAENRSLSDPTDPESELCGGIPKDAMHLFRDNNSDLPWTGIVFGLSISSIWYWCTDQVNCYTSSFAIKISGTKIFYRSLCNDHWLPKTWHTPRLVAWWPDIWSFCQCGWWFFQEWLPELCSPTKLAVLTPKPATKSVNHRKDFFRIKLKTDAKKKKECLFLSIALVIPNWFLQSKLALKSG